MRNPVYQTLNCAALQVIVYDCIKSNLIRVIIFMYVDSMHLKSSNSIPLLVIAISISLWRFLGLSKVGTTII